MKKIVGYIKKPKKMIIYLMNKGFFKWLSDETYLKIKYRLIMDKKLNLSNPSTFNEKLQWLKIHNRKPEYTMMVDKYEVRKYISKTLGEEYLIPLIGVYDNPEEIDFDALPNQFVIKCTHDSGTAIVCKDKNKLDIKKIKRNLKKNLKRKYFYIHREWPYKNVKRRIIIEEYIEDTPNEELKDYKFFCFNGNIKVILVCSNRKGIFKNTDFFDKNWELMPFTRQNHKNNSNKISKPKNLEEMLQIVERLSINIPFVRVDLYEIKGRVYFGELTFYPSSGFEGFEPKEYDKILGDMLELPINKINNKT